MAISYKQVSTLQRIWDSLTSLVGLKSIGNPLTDPLVIDEPLTLYVETTGNDGNPGTPDRPFKTIQAQIDSLDGYKIRTLVNIQVGLGTFAGFNLGGLNIDIASRAGGEAVGVMVSGTMVALDSGTVTGSAANQLTDSGKTWTADVYKGKLVQYTIGTTVGANVIWGNSATAITHSSSSSGQIGQPYVIYDWGTFITNDIKAAQPQPSWSDTAQATTTLQYGAVVYQMQKLPSSPTRQSVRIRKLNFDVGASSNGVGFFNGASGSVYYCRFRLSGNTGAAGVRVGSGDVDVTNNTFEFSVNGRGIVAGQIDTGQLRMTSTSNLFRSMSGVQGTGIAYPSVTLTFGSTATGFFDHMSVGIDLTGASGNISTQPICNGCTTCVSATSVTGMPAFSVSLPTSGASFSLIGGNTTGISIVKGAKCFILTAGLPIGAATELTYDGVNSTVAALEALNPKLLTNTYGTIIYE